MSTRRNQILAALLVVQVGLVALTWQTESDGPVRSGKPLLGLNLDDITALEVSERPRDDQAKKESIRLAKKDGKWVVASAADFPADEKKVTDLLKSLVEIRQRRPIAERPENHAALRVDERTYSRKVELVAGAEKRRLIIGQGSNSSVHLRVDGGDQVYLGRGISSYKLGANIRSYADTSYVQVKADEVAEISVTNEKGELHLRKASGSWSLAELPAGKVLDTSKVNTFVSSIGRVTLNEPIGKALEPAFGLDKPVATVEIRPVSGDPIVYKIGGPVEGDDKNLYVKSDKSDYVVSVAKWATDAARLRDPAYFVKEEKPAGASGAATSAAFPP